MLKFSARRNDFIALLMYLTERKLFFSANHVFSGLTGRRKEEAFHWFESYVPAFETPTADVAGGQMIVPHGWRRGWGKSRLPGSDSHTINSVGHTFTEVPGARTVDEFFAGLRQDADAVHGAARELRQAHADVFSIVRFTLL